MRAQMKEDFLTMERHYAVILAGGDGTRLQAMTREIAGDSRPKQFCRLFSDVSLLSATRGRIASIFHEERTLFVLSQAHAPFYREELRDIHPSRMIVQPANRGTAVAMALCLQNILREDEKATVAFFPSDHHYADCSAFRKTIGHAINLAEEYPQSVLVIGAEPVYAEVEYGWIELGRTVVDSNAGRLYRVSRFWEKPKLHVAESLKATGGLWNTFVTIGLVSAFVDLIYSAVPGLATGVEKICNDHQLRRFYEQTPSIDFSRAVLEPLARRLMVLKDADSGWTDLGNPQRVTEVIKTLNRPLIQALPGR